MLRMLKGTGPSNTNALQNTQQQMLQQEQQDQIDEMNTQMAAGHMTSQSNQMKTMSAAYQTSSNNVMNAGAEQQKSSKDAAATYSAD